VRAQTALPLRQGYDGTVTNLWTLFRGADRWGNVLKAVSQGGFRTVQQLRLKLAWWRVISPRKSPKLPLPSVPLVRC